VHVGILVSQNVGRKQKLLITSVVDDVETKNKIVLLGTAPPTCKNPYGKSNSLALLFLLSAKIL
jgi:hypothetical protein